MKYILIILALNLFIGCETRESNRINSNEPISNEKEITVRAQYASKGLIINSPVNITQEISYENGEIIRDKTTSKSGSMTFSATQEYDSKQRLERLKSETNGKLSVSQINKYTGDDLLLSELRIEDNGSGFDTTLYEYQYPDESTNPMTYYRTKNREKLTEFLLTKSNNMEVLQERYIGDDKYIGIITTTKKFNSKGEVIEKQQTNISSDYSDKTKLDTSIYKPTFYKYDESGRVISEESEEITSANGMIKTSYHKNGIIKKKIITRKGDPIKTIVFKPI